MGTGVEQPPVNDNELHWHLKGPDEAGNVWLVWNGAGDMLNLGPKEFVSAAFTEWLCGMDFG